MVSITIRKLHNKVTKRLNYLPFSAVPKIRARTEFTMERMRLKSNAHQKFRTSKSLSKASATRMMQALMTSRNNPSVTRVAGIVSNTRIGFRKAFRNDKTSATIMASQIRNSSTPGRIAAVSNTAMDETKTCASHFCMWPKYSFSGIPETRFATPFDLFLPG